MLRFSEFIILFLIFFFSFFSFPTYSMKIYECNAILKERSLRLYPESRPFS